MIKHRPLTPGETHADLIVTGMTGTEKDIRRPFGSATTTLARKTRIPLLVVPEGAGFTPPIAIAIADDVFGESDRVVPSQQHEGNDLRDQHSAADPTADQRIDFFGLFIHFKELGL